MHLFPDLQPDSYLHFIVVLQGLHWYSLSWACWESLKTIILLLILSALHASGLISTVSLCSSTIVTVSPWNSLTGCCSCCMLAVTTLLLTLILCSSPTTTVSPWNSTTGCCSCCVLSVTKLLFRNAHTLTVQFKCRLSLKQELSHTAYHKSKNNVLQFLQRACPLLLASVYITANYFMLVLLIALVSTLSLKWHHPSHLICASILLCYELTLVCVRGHCSHCFPTCKWSYSFDLCWQSALSVSM